ncbi:MAG: anti-sigma factor family protein [Gemmatimonadota bacterium]
MDHLNDAGVQALLDGELPPDERDQATAHLAGCASCREIRDELARANAVFSEAVAALDVEVRPARRPEAARSGWRLTTPFVRAAVLVLLLAAAASAIPGSPVRGWIESVVTPRTPTVVPEVVTPVPEVLQPAPDAAPAGVALSPVGAVEIVVSGLEDTSILLVETDEPEVSTTVAATERDPVFRTGPGRIEVTDGVGGRLTVALPRSLASVRLVVDGQLYAEKEAGTLTVHVPGETVDGMVVWP